MRKLAEFTAEIPVWSPYVTPVALSEATPEQRDAMKITPSNTKIGDYVLVLAHDPDSLAARTPLFNAILYNRGGLSRAERELGATGASVVNRCVYCAAVHASRFNQLTKEPEAMERVFADGEAADLGPRRSAILRFASRLSETPPAAGAEEMAALREAGLDETEILDLILSAALFGWANRLMHTLGAPVAPESDQPPS